MACVRHQTPAVGDLQCIGARLLRRQRIAAVSIPSHDGVPPLVAQPRLGGRCFSIRRQRDGLSAFEITDQRSIAMVAAPSPVVDPEDRRRRDARAAALAYSARNRMSLLTGAPKRRASWGIRRSKGRYRDLEGL